MGRGGAKPMSCITRSKLEAGNGFDTFQGQIHFSETQNRLISLVSMFQAPGKLETSLFKGTWELAYPGHQRFFLADMTRARETSGTQRRIGGELMPTPLAKWPTRLPASSA